MYNRGNFSDGYTILGPAICTLPRPYYKIGNKTIFVNMEHCEQGCQEENQVSLG